MNQSGSMCQLELGSVASMRIKAVDLLDSPPPNRDDEIDEISVPFGPAPAEQIARPGRTNKPVQSNAVCTGIYTPSSEGLSSPSRFKQYQSEKMTQRSLNKETRLFFCQFIGRSGTNTRWPTRPLQPQAGTASHVDSLPCPDERATNKVLTP